MNYIGSKLSLLPFIFETVESLSNLPKQPSICDMFTGTGIVAKSFKKRNYQVMANDLQYYSYVRAKHFIENNENLNFINLIKLGITPFEYLNNLQGRDGFIYNNYAPSGTINGEYTRVYFSDKNAKKIDAIRLKIEEWKEKKLINDSEYFYLIASLIESADKVANTASVYEAFLKKIKKTAQKELTLLPLDIVISNNKTKNQVFNKDANVLIREIKGDILYLDPPYNTRKYNTNYHMLETIALYDNPKIKGKTGVRVDKEKISKYSSKKEARFAFKNLIENADFKYILLSYNDEGIISLEEIEEIMSKYGKYSRKEMKYKRFKADKDSNREHKKDSVVEYIHCLEKNR
jgi:adenine-specific methyltransferase